MKITAVSSPIIVVPKLAPEYRKVLRKNFKLLVRWDQRKKLNRRGRMVKFTHPHMGYVCGRMIGNDNIPHIVGGDFYLVDTISVCETCALDMAHARGLKVYQEN